MITTKQQRDEAVEGEGAEWLLRKPQRIDPNYEFELRERVFATDGTPLTPMKIYRAGTNSLANLEWIVRRAVEMARTIGSDHTIDSLYYALGKGGYMEYSPEEIITTLAKEMGIEEAGK